MSDLETKADPLQPLVRRYLLSGDEDALDALVQRTRPRLLAVARRIGAPQDAEDAVQGAYLALVRKRGSPLDAPVMPWLLTTVVRLAYRRKAKQARQRELAERLARPREPEAPERAALQAERAARVRGAVARLPDGYRDALVLRHLEGLTTGETAALLEISEAAVRSRVHRGLQLLRGPMAPAIMSLLFALPWLAADIWRRVVPITRPALGRPWAVAAVTGGLLLGGLALLGGPGLGGGAGTPAPATVPAHGPAVAGGPRGVTSGGAPPPEAEREREGDVPPPGDPPPSPVHVPGGAAPAEEPAAPGREETAPSTTGPEPPRPGTVPVDLGGPFHAPEPPGMVHLDGGHVRIGTDRDELDRLLAGRPAEHRRLFLFEAPSHDVFLRPFGIGRYEVTNAQYLRYLEQQAVQHVVRVAGDETLESVAGRLAGLTEEQAQAPRATAWRQLYRANKGRIWRALGRRMDALFAWTAQREVDEDATADRLRREPLPVGLVLDFYRVPPPWHWPDLKPPPGEEDHPVRCISYDQAERFAEWAGMHLPTEEEWEWAARGPEQRRFPWGDAWFADASHAAWGGHVRDARHETTTLPVGSRGAPVPGEDPHGDGRSWCGVHDLCGNVAEWTSSWFRAYPGSDLAHSFMGRYVKVIRGGGTADGEMLVLRPACRNFVGAGPEAPPYPENSFQWVGMRLAAWAQPGRDHVPPVVRRAVRGRRLDPEDVDPDRFAAFVTRDWAAAGEPVAHHVYVRGAARAVVFVPVAALLRESGAFARQQGWKRPSTFRTTSGLLRHSVEDGPWTLGVLHTDLVLHGLQVPDDRVPGPARRPGGAAPALRTRTGDVAAGTYLLTVWQRRLALHTPTLEFAGFLLEPEGPLPSVEVRPRPSTGWGPPTLTPSLEAGEGDLEFWLPVGGRRDGDAHGVHVRTRLPFPPGELFARAPWLRSR